MDSPCFSEIVALPSLSKFSVPFDFPPSPSYVYEPVDGFSNFKTKVNCFSKSPAFPATIFSINKSPKVSFIFLKET